MAGRYLLVACISGRPGVQARELVGVPGIRYVGNHGLELHPAATEAAAAIARFRERTRCRWPVEDKALTLSYHFREAADEEAARATLSALAREAAEAGLEPRWGRKVLEIRPRLAADKGTAVRALLAEAGAAYALYAGDDATDLDAFAALAAAGLETAVCIAVSSSEAPPELIAAADLAVDGPAGLLELLQEL